MHDGKFSFFFFTLTQLFIGMTAKELQNRKVIFLYDVLVDVAVAVVVALASYCKLHDNVPFF